MEGHPRAGRLADTTGQPVVVGVDVRHQHALHIGDVEPGGDETPAQDVVGVVGVPAGVDEIWPPIGLERVDEDVPQRVVGDGDGDAPQTRAHPLDRRQRLLDHQNPAPPST